MGRIKEIDVLLKTYNIVPTAYTAPQNAEASRMNIAYNLRPTTTAQLDYCPPSKRKYLDVSQSNVPSSTARTEKRRKFSPKAELKKAKPITTRNTVETNGIKITSINHLPNEILAQIFSKVGIPDLLRLEIVCRRWASVVSEHAWNEVDTLSAEMLIHDPRYKAGYTVGIYHIRSLLNRCFRYLKKIYLAGFSDMLKTVICLELKCQLNSAIYQAKSLPAIEEIDASKSLILVSGEHKIIKLLSNTLKVVKVQGVYMPSTCQSELFEEIGKCNQLQSLDISEINFRLVPSSIEKLPQSLLNLNMSRCEMSGGCVARLVEKCHELRVLTSTNNCFRGRGAINMFKRMSRLEELDLSHCDILQLNDETNDNLFDGLKYLRKLWLSKSDFIDDMDLFSLSSNCKELEELNIDRSANDILRPAILTFYSLQQLAKLRKLSIIHMSNQINLDDNILMSIAEHSVLEELHIAGCSRITNKAIIYVLNTCKNLHTLNASNIPLLTFASLKEVFRIMKSHPNEKFVKNGQSFSMLPDMKFKRFIFENTGIHLTKAIKRTINGIVIEITF
ncbi:f-box-like domain-containing protein [Ditylenchus destructor]|uniref:F-box-like domain-containing protein n=1 Tax=Ditylenchus destructor TaxID=166010 RepID=A0AAD4RBA4_9BILA|nr:f-box-like domain-containing protein [Ditylenchus destructor]